MADVGDDFSYESSFGVLPEQFLYLEHKSPDASAWNLLDLFHSRIPISIIRGTFKILWTLSPPLNSTHADVHSVNVRPWKSKGMRGYASCSKCTVVGALLGTSCQCDLHNFICKARGTANPLSWGRRVRWISEFSKIVWMGAQMKCFACTIGRQCTSLFAANLQQVDRMSVLLKGVAVLLHIGN